MSEQVLPPEDDSNLEHDLDETAVDDTPPEDITEPKSPVLLSTVRPEDSPDMVIQRTYDYHKIDAGMVEVSLALAALIFTVSTFGAGNLEFNWFVWLMLMFLVLVSNFAALWFLAAYCVQQNIVEGNPDECWHTPAVIIKLMDIHAGVYFLLAFCLVLLVIMFFVVSYRYLPIP